ncbi:MAG: hypothetical protein WD066_10285 [Planctomycetaceae bacterium]
MLILAFASIARAEDDSIPKVVPRVFAIELVRPERAGNVFEVSLRAERKIGYRGGPRADDSIEKAKNARVQTRSQLIELDAHVEVLKVDSEGRVLKQALTVTRWKFDDDDDGDLEFDLLRKMLIAETIDGETQFSIDGEPVNEYHCELLRMIVTTYRGGGSVDAEFGSRQRRKVGETWPVHLDDEAKAAFGRSLPTEASWQKALPAGTAKLTKVATVANVPCLFLDVEFECSNSPALRELFSDSGDENVPVEHTELTYSFSGQYPVDSARHCARQRETCRFMAITTTTDESYWVQQVVEDTVTREFRNAREKD